MSFIDINEREILIPFLELPGYLSSRQSLT
jgi:hypothetical protein